MPNFQILLLKTQIHIMKNQSNAKFHKNILIPNLKPLNTPENTTSIIKQGFQKQSLQFQKIISIMESMAITQKKYLNKIVIEIRNNKKHKNFVSSSPRSLIDQSDSKLGNSQKFEINKFQKHNFRNKKNHLQIQKSYNDDQSSEVLSQQQEHLPQNKQFVESIFKKQHFSNQQQLPRKGLSKVQKKPLQMKTMQECERQNHHIDIKDLPKQKYVQKSNTDYKDRFLNIKLVCVNNTQKYENSQNYKTQINGEHNLLQSQIKQSSQSTLIQAKIFQQANSKSIKRWISQLLNTLCKESFYGLLSKKMTENETKVFFCKNYIHNYINARQIIKNHHLHQQLQNIFLQIFQRQSKQSLRFMKLKYPQQEKNYVDQKIYNLIPAIDISSNYQSHVINELGFGRKAFGWREIKQFINALIKQTNQHFLLFKQRLSDLFWFWQSDDENRRGKNIEMMLNSSVNSKIKPNTPTYSAQELEQDGLIIKSPQIMRVIIKWIQHLQEMINHHANGQVYHQMFQKDTPQFQTIVQNMRKNSFYNKQIQVYEPLKVQKQYQKTVIQSFSKCVIETINLHKSKFEMIPSEEVNVGMFTAITTQAIKNVASTHLYYLLNRLNFMTTKSYKKSQIFPIFDMFRGKCSGTSRQIQEVYEKLKKSNFNIIKVKNRINTPNNDFLINLTMKDISFVCELQLHVKDKKYDQNELHKQICSNSFNHFLYELQRSKYGPLNQCVTLFESQDDIPSYFNKIKLEKLTNWQKKPLFNKKVYITQQFDVKIEDDDCFQIMNGQQTEVFCNYCFNTYEKSSFSLPFAVRKIDKVLVCSHCLFSCLQLEDRKKLILKEYHSFFQEIENYGNFVNLNPQYLVCIQKKNKEMFIFRRYDQINSDTMIPIINQRKVYLSSKSEILPQQQAKMLQISQDLFKKYFIYIVKDQNSLSSSLIQPNNLEQLLSQKNSKLISQSKYLGYTLVYIQNVHRSGNQKGVFVVDVINNRSQQRKKKVLEICKFISKAEEYAKINTMKWNISYPPIDDCQLFKYLPKSLSETLYDLTIITPLKEVPCLHIQQLGILKIVLNQQWKEIKLQTLQSPSLRKLNIILNSQNDSVDIQNIPFIDLVTLEITFKKSFKYLNFKNRRPSSLELDDLNKIEKQQSGLIALQKQDLKNLEQISLQFCQQSGEVSFEGISLPNLSILDLNVKSSLELLNLRSIRLPKLEALNFCEGIKNIEGFESENNPYIPELRTLIYKSECCVVDLKYLCVQNLKEYFCVPAGPCTITHPVRQFLKLEKLVVSNSYMPSQNIKCLENLKILNLNGVQGFIQRFEQYSKELSSLNQLILKKQPHLQSNICEQSIKFNHEMMNLEYISITGYYSIQFNAYMPLKILIIEGSSQQILDISCLPNRLQQLTLWNNHKLSEIIFQEGSLQPQMRKLDLKNNNLKPEFMKGTQFSKNYFQNLKKISINQEQVNDFKFWQKWDEMKTPKLLTNRLVFE